MLSSEEIMQLIGSLIWLLAGVGVFIVGMNFLGDALEKSAGSGMKRLLERISNNRFSGVGIGAGVTAIIQSSSATSVMVIGLVHAGVMTLMQATPIIMGANIGTTITGVLVALKNDYFNMAMYLLAFAGVMMGFAKKEKIKLAGLLCSGLGLIFVGLEVMSSDQAFGNELVETMFTGIFQKIDFPLLLILVGIIFTGLIQSSSAATGVVITMVGTGVLPLHMALFIVLGANIGTCVTALLASVGANANSKRVALIHFTFNVIGTVFFTAIIWLFKDPVVNMLVSIFPGSDPMSLQMRVSLFHVVFNVTTTVLLLPFVKQLVDYSCKVIKDKEKEEKDVLELKSGETPQLLDWTRTLKIEPEPTMFWAEDDDNYMPKEWGNLVHDILSKINTIEDADRVFANYVNEGSIDKQKADKLKRQFEKIVDLKEVKEAYSKNAIVRNEIDILTYDSSINENVILRPDRYAELEDKVILIDYKTGEHHKKYYEQLQNYADALRGMGVEKVIEPYLVYISKEDEKVDIKPVFLSTLF